MVEITEWMKVVSLVAMRVMMTMICKPSSQLPLVLAVLALLFCQKKNLEWLR